MRSPDRILPYIPAEEIGTAIQPNPRAAAIYPHFYPESATAILDQRHRELVARERFYRQNYINATPYSEEPRDIWPKYQKADVHDHLLMTADQEIGVHSGIFYEDEIRTLAQHFGHEFLAVTPHTSDPGNPAVLEKDAPIAEKLRQQQRSVTLTNRAAIGHESIGLVSGAEMNVFHHGSEHFLDLPQDVVAALDYPIASFHEGASKNIALRKAALVSVIQNPHVAAIGHPDRHFQYKTNWDMLRENNDEAQALHAEKEREEAQKKAFEDPNAQSADPLAIETVNQSLEQKYLILKKAIGEVEMTRDDAKNFPLQRMRRKYIALKSELHEMWQTVLPMMRAYHVAFEYNLREPAEPWLMAMVKDYQVPIVISTDLHDFNDFDAEITDETIRREYQDKYRPAREAIRNVAAGNMSDQDLDTIEAYKRDRLAGLPKPVLEAFTKELQVLIDLGIKPEQVVNRSLASFVAFLQQKKQTENLGLLAHIAEQQKTTRNRSTMATAA